MNAACKDSSEGDPEEYDRSPERTLHGAEDRAEACDVEELNKKELPLGEYDKVDSVVDSYCGSLAVIRCEGVVDHFGVGQITKHDEAETDNKTDHNISLPFCRIMIKAIIAL